MEYLSLPKGFKKIRCGSWSWFLRDAAVLDGWFDSASGKIIAGEVVKQNTMRSVFKVENSAGSLFVKYDTPQGLFANFKALFRCKVEQEFRAGELLKSVNVPVVDFLGWGVCGSRGMLVSQARQGVVSSHDLWFDKAANSPKMKSHFLEKISIFVKRFATSELFHPDFHLGNILVEEENMDFLLVDPYGVKKSNSERIKRLALFSVARIIGSFRGELVDAEAVDFLIASGFANNRVYAEKLWLEILQAEYAEMHKVWAKRKKQILSGLSKYSMRYGSVDIRKSHSGVLLADAAIFTASDVTASFDAFEKLELPLNKALEIWLDSFKLQFLRIAHQMPVVMQRGASSDKASLFFLNEELRKPEKDDNANVQEFLARCLLAGVEVASSQIRISVKTGKVKLLLSPSAI